MEENDTLLLFILLLFYGVSLGVALLLWARRQEKDRRTIRMLRTTLRYYANPMHYSGPYWTLDNDQGAFARQALHESLEHELSAVAYDVDPRVKSKDAPRSRRSNGGASSRAANPDHR